MFDIEKKIQELLWNTFYLRWKEYFYKDLIKSLKIFDDWDYIQISAKVIWNIVYDTVIWIDAKWNLGTSCSCPAFNDVQACKHLAWLAIKVNNDYKITDNFNFIDRKTWKTLNLDFLNNKSSKNNENSKVKNEQFEINKLSIFSKMLSKNNDDINEEQFYKIKLGFLNKNKDIDISLNLYKSKLQKNWKLSSWTMIKREKLNEAPFKFQFLAPYLETRNSDSYWYNEDYLTFSSSSKNFIQTLFEFDEIYDIGNNLITLHKEIFELNIEVEKQNNWYKIYLSWVWKTIKLRLTWCQIIWNNFTKYFWWLLWDNHLIFFMSNLNYDFIKELSKWEIILNKKEFEELKNKKEFKYIIEHIWKIDDLDIDYEEIEPSLKVKIEIPNDYSFVKIETLICYDDIELIDSNINKQILVNGKKIIKRNIEKEIEKFKTLWLFFSKFDESNKNIWKKYIDENIDSFFDEVENLIKLWVKVEYKQTAKRIINTT